MHSKRLSLAVAGALLGSHVALLAWAGARHSPVSDETGHLTGGIYIWHFGRFDLYNVNPPLVRAVASLPVVCCGPKTDWTRYRTQPGARHEWGIGRDFLRANSAGGFLAFFVMSRWMLIPLLVLGGCVCWRWADQLYGPPCGLMALALWCFSPNVIAWGATICPDAVAAALGVTSAYLFWRWIEKASWTRALIAGVTLGLAELTKFTWIVLFVLWPALWLLWRIRIGKRGGPRREDERDKGAPRSEVAPRKTWWRQERGQLAAILLLGLYLIHLGYGFEGSFQPLRHYTFVSRTLAGSNSLATGGKGGNRFAHSWLGLLPVPLPKNYLAGMDLQKLDFEQGAWSFLHGQWKHGGWWYYYLYAALIKLPLGTWALTLVALGLRLGLGAYHRDDAGGRGRSASSCDAHDECSVGWRNEITLLAPAVIVVILVSSQTGFSRHFRYVLPAFPFFFVWVSKVIAPVYSRRPVVVSGISTALLVWSLASSLWVYPHSKSYFNELAGGPAGGHKYLNRANIDWQQDMVYLKEWLDKHPEVYKPYLIYQGHLDPRQYGIEFRGARAARRPSPYGTASQTGGNDVGPWPGWYAVSVSRIRDRQGEYLYFLHLKPTAMVGYSIYIYHITPEQADRMRREMGLPPLRTFARRFEYQFAGTLVDGPGQGICSHRPLVSTTDCDSARLRVAIFNVDGRHNRATGILSEIVNSEPGWTCEWAAPADIRTGVLESFNAVIFPGGSGRKQAEALGDNGGDAVRQFVKVGGGYVGICGGAFLATAGYDWSLALVNAKTVTGDRSISGIEIRSMADRGRGTVRMELTDAGKRILGNLPGLVDVRYSGGPILLPAGREDLPESIPLALYRTEVWRYQPQRGTMTGTAAIAAAHFGKGRVIVFSSHPEMTEGLQSLVKRAVLWVARESRSSNCDK